MNRQNQILTGLLVVQIILGIVIFLPRAAQPSVEVTPLLEGFDPDDVAELTIHNMTNENQVTLARNEDDDWVLPESGDYPVQEESVEELLDKIAGIDTSRLIATSGTSHNRLRVSEGQYERLIEIRQTGSEEAVRFYIGTSGGAGAAHVRLGGQDNVYLARGLSAWEAAAQPTSWIDTVYFSVPREQVVAIHLENPNGTFELTKTGEAWTLAGLEDGEIFDPQSANTLLSRVAQVQMTRPLGKEAEEDYGMDAPQATVTVTVEEPAETEGEGQGEGEDATEEATIEPEAVQTTYMLTVGAEIGAEEEGEASEGYVFKSSESEYYILVATHTGGGLIDMTRDDFLTEPTPTPTLDPAAEPTPTGEPIGPQPSTATPEAEED